MLIKRIKARNFKTYLNLDLDISVSSERPIILIGGANGGGKTTFFESIYGALYGLKIHNAKQFKELLNAGALGKEEERIILEIQFSGKVLNEEQQYVLTRTYALNTEGKPVESVKLNMNGTIFQYGTATPVAQRTEQEAQVNKIIKANLPQELSRYFLFDAMEAGNLLKEDQLNRVIRENIENVMGFNKYMNLARSSEHLFQDYTAQRLQVENEKSEYLELVNKKKDLENVLSQTESQHQDALQYSVANKELYDSLKSGLNHEATLKNKIDQTKLQIDSIRKKEALYKSDVDDFIKNFESHICMPKLTEALKNEISLILKSKSEQDQNDKSKLSSEQIEAISQIVVRYLKEKALTLKEVTSDELVDYILSVSDPNTRDETYSFLEYSEVKALSSLVNGNYTNPFPNLNQQQIELNLSIGQIPSLENQVELLKSQIAGRDYTLLKAYEDNEASIKMLELKITELKGEILKIDKRIHQFDIQTSQEPDPRYEALQKLKPFFEDVANKLLKSKKQQIELKMKQDLNINLAAYKDVIERVELSENLKDLTFKIYHKAGNEIYLNQLNTASKQVVVQVLLKALHEFGDYDPPVMIDTVMGVLDETSRSTVMENYFPELSHQTILLSSDSEIRPDKDLVKIAPFVCKTFTVQRDREKQATEIVEGYFGYKNEN
jgi:DNA sulfur modification protein DndD